MKRIVLALSLAVAACAEPARLPHVEYVPPVPGDTLPPIQPLQSYPAAQSSHPIVLPVPVYRPAPMQPPPIQPTTTQTYILPSGRMMNCTTFGTVTNCY